MGPCVWPVNYGACTDLSTFEEAGREVQELAEAIATEHLWRWTDRVFGQCPQVLRPCMDRELGRLRPWTNTLVSASSRSPWVPVIIGGSWYNITSCRTCVNPEAALILPSIVSEVTRVVIGGIELPPESWRFENGVLLRLDGTWPTWQNLAAPEGSAESWEVHILYGAEVPMGGRVAAGVLANEFVKAMCNDDTCALPANVVSVSRLGVSMEMDQIEWQDAQGGKTGLWIVDSWILSVTSTRRPSTVLSPDTMIRGRRVR